MNQIELGVDEHLIKNIDGSLAFILNVKTRKARPISKSIDSTQKADSAPQAVDIEADFLKLAKIYVDNQECKNMSCAIEKVCREYPNLYKKYSNEHTLVARE